MKAKQPDYGLDAPGVVRGFLFGGPALAISGWFLGAWARHREIGPFIGLSNAMFCTGIVLFIEAFLMIASSRYGKFRARDKLLASLNLRGDESVLDLGCGHGLLLIGAAKLLPRGRAVGVDLWSQVDQGSNSKEATLENARLEGVSDRVEVQTGDMRKLPFADSTFDAIVANLAIHNISNREGRREAIRESVRVLKPGGRFALMDFKHVGQYAADLKACGIDDARASGPIFSIFPPVRVAKGTKR
jgi:SAM-dependent methyltransferase